MAEEHTFVGPEAGRPERLTNQLATLALLLLFAVGLVAIAGLLYATSQSDKSSIDRQARGARQALDIALDDFALQQETVAVWDDSAMKLSHPTVDRQWLTDNIGLWLHNIFGHDVAVIVDGNDRLVQITFGGVAGDGSLYNRYRPEFAELLRAVRGKSHDLGTRHDRRLGQAPMANTTVRTTARATHVTRLARVLGRPALISAMLVKPSTPHFVDDRGSPPVLISVRYLDTGFINDLGKLHLLDHARFGPESEAGRGQAALPIEDTAGLTLGYLIWRPELPGQDVRGSLLPGTAGAILILALVMSFLTSRLKLTVRERGMLQARAAHLAWHDPLTGLPNRELLNVRTVAALKSNARRGGIALMMIDLDRFKQVNDTLGHLAGDELICEVGSRLVGLVRPGDTVGRLGGDEFAIVLCDNWKRAEIEELAEAIVGQFAEPFELFGTTVFGGASIGLAFAARAADDPTELLRMADVALYRAKADGRGCARAFDSDMDEAGKARARLEAELRTAVDERQFALWCQPQVSPSGLVVGQEVLLRWNHSVLGPISPHRVIRLAEETGLILPLGRWVIEEAARIARHSLHIFTAVNLSPVQLRQTEFAAEVIAIFAAAGVNPRRVELEVTEGILLEDGWAASANLVELRKAGFRIALDDFGTGYSSLSYLRRFSVDKIKIDRSFVLDVQQCGEARAIVAAIVAIGRTLGLTVSAEGIETREQADVMSAAGCDQLQGYLFGPPVPFATRSKAA